MTFTPSFHDLAHLAHLELLTPKPEESLAFFTKIVGLHESGRSGDSVYLRAWGDYERASLKLTAAKTSGLGHVALRTRSGQVLTQLAEHLSQHGIKGEWIDRDLGHGPAFRFPDPDGHRVEIYYETERFVPTGDQVPGFKNLPQRYSPHGIAPRRLDHINLFAKDVKATGSFFKSCSGFA
jgi:catechol 2,3-dioxygenase